VNSATFGQFAAGGPGKEKTSGKIDHKKKPSNSRANFPFFPSWLYVREDPGDIIKSKDDLRTR
jgi:hypothetical protein